jgi:HD superfamily phosphohydrolase
MHIPRRHAGCPRVVARRPPEREKGADIIAQPREPKPQVVRDLLWGDIRLEPAAVRVVDAPEFQRLRYVRQLGHAFLVYPGAAHSRFEHALGTYHLACRALAGLARRGGLDGLGEGDALLIRLAALVHDVGHYPFSHALEESGFLSHESRGAAYLARGALADAVEASGVPGGAAAIGAVMTGTSDHPLAGLVAGSIDLDKIDYLKRDALMCGVPYGEIDVDRLLACLAVVELDGLRRIGVLEKGLAALESLLFAKYQMYRNVYWHHAVRSATAMFKRLVSAAVQGGAAQPARLADATDDVLIHDLVARDPTGIAAALRERRLYKRALELLPGELRFEVPSWAWQGGEKLEQAEDALAKRVGLAPGALLIDFPHKTAMLGLDLPVERSDGSVERLTDAGWPGRMDLPRMAEDLVETARRLRVFVARPVAVGRDDLIGVLSA